MIPVSIFISYRGIIRSETANHNESKPAQSSEVVWPPPQLNSDELSDAEYREIMLEKDCEIRLRHHMDGIVPSWDSTYNDRLKHWENEVYSLRENMARFESGKGDPMSVYSQMQIELKTLLQHKPGDSDSIK